MGADLSKSLSNIYLLHHVQKLQSGPLLGLENCEKHCLFPCASSPHGAKLSIHIPGSCESLDNGDDGKELWLCKQGHAEKPVKGSSIDLLRKGRGWGPGAFLSQLLWLFPSLTAYAGILVSDLSFCWTNVYSAGLRRILPSVGEERMKSLGLVTLARRLNTTQAMVA